MERIRIGIVGADASGQGWAPLSHLPALKMLPEYEIVAVCTAHADTAAAAAAKYSVNRAFHDYNAMVREPTVDLVSVVVKVPAHHDVVVAALNAGKHLYCEWPLGANLAEAEAMAEIAQRKDVRAMMGLQARGDPTVRYLRQLIADRYVGDVLAVNMTMFTGGVLERPQSRLWDRDRAKGVSALTVRGILGTVADSRFAHGGPRSDARWTAPQRGSSTFAWPERSGREGRSSRLRPGGEAPSPDRRDTAIVR